MSVSVLGAFVTSLISKGHVTVIIHEYGVILWRYRGCGQIVLIIYQVTGSKIIRINQNLLDYIILVVSKICPPLSPLVPVDHDGLGKAGEFIFRIH